MAYARDDDPREGLGANLALSRAILTAVSPKIIAPPSPTGISIVDRFRAATYQPPPAPAPAPVSLPVVRPATVTSTVMSALVNRVAAPPQIPYAPPVVSAPAPVVSTPVVQAAPPVVRAPVVAAPRTWRDVVAGITARHATAVQPSPLVPPNVAAPTTVPVPVEAKPASTGPSLNIVDRIIDAASSVAPSAPAMSSSPSSGVPASTQVAANTPLAPDATTEAGPSMMSMLSGGGSSLWIFALAGAAFLFMGSGSSSRKRRR